jgi:putative ribosome biogenesis GTPase RsgA
MLWKIICAADHSACPVLIAPGTVALQDELLCKMRSLMYKRGEKVLVGDRVRVMNIDWQDARGLIFEALPRSTEIKNPKVANVDHFAVVFSIADPPFEPFQATRFLIAAASSRVQCSLVLNKCDLVPEAEVAAQIERVRSWGYEAVPVSVQSGQGMDKARPASSFFSPCARDSVCEQFTKRHSTQYESMLQQNSEACRAWLAGGSSDCNKRMQLRSLLRDRTSVLAGPSGVGKSSIVNALRFVALDAAQRVRLAAFEEAMAEEYDWKLSDSDEEEGGEDTHTVVRKGPVPVSSHARAMSSAQEEADCGGAQPGVGDASGAAPSEQSAWKRRSGNIYGAQVRSA